MSSFVVMSTTYNDSSLVQIGSTLLHLSKLHSVTFVVASLPQEQFIPCRHCLLTSLPLLNRMFNHIQHAKKKIKATVALLRTLVYCHRDTIKAQLDRRYACVMPCNMHKLVVCSALV